MLRRMHTDTVFWRIALSNNFEAFIDFGPMYLLVEHIVKEIILNTGKFCAERYSI